MPLVAASLAPVPVEGVVGADQSWSRVPPEDLKAQGIFHLLRYTQDPGAKGMDQAEVDRYTAAGITLTAINESFAQAFTNGYGQGQREAMYSFGRMDALGFGRDRICYFVAEDPTVLPRSAWPAVVDAFKAVRDVGTGRPLQGAYGSGALCGYLRDQGLISREWHVSTWPGADRSRAAIVQEANGIAGQTTFGGAIDLNTIYDENVPRGDWGQHPFDPPSPSGRPAHNRAIQEDAMLIYSRPDNGGIWLLTPDGKHRHLPSIAGVEALKASGVPDVGEVTEDFWTA